MYEDYEIVFCIPQQAGERLGELFPAEERFLEWIVRINYRLWWVQFHACGSKQLAA